jgi:two-component system, NtrC family, nitrogen regulation response regulator GlnG
VSSGPNDTTLHTEEGAAGIVFDTPIPQLTILNHPDPSRVGHRSWLNDPGGAGAVRLSRMHPLFGPPGQPDQAPLQLPHLSRRPLLIRLHDDGGATLSAPADATKLSLDGEPFVGERRFDAEALRQGVVLELAARVVLLLHAGPMVTPSADDMGLIGVSAGLREVRSAIERVAPHDVPVLVRGESGTGKELVAAAIHAYSARADEPFVSLNMAALVPSTASAALFGHVKGAFTGANEASKGFYGQADGGTLFLDEIGETPSAIQPVLLRALESGEVQVMGSDRTAKRDVRLVAATDADLEAAAASGAFRLPLLQRLQGYVVQLPPLRQRREDIGVLLLHFLREALGEMGQQDRLAPRDLAAKPWLPAAVVTRAALHSWPGNVRELRNVARQLAIDFGARPRVELSPALDAQLPLSSSAKPQASASAKRSHVEGPSAETREPIKASDLTDEVLLAALRDHDFKPQLAAVALGVSRTTLYAAIEASDQIRKAADLTAEEIERVLAKADGGIDAAARTLEVSSRGLRLRMKSLGLR